MRQSVSFKLNAQKEGGGWSSIRVTVACCKLQHHLQHTAIGAARGRARSLAQQKQILNMMTFSHCYFA